MVQMCQFVPYINQLVVVSGCGSEGGCGCKWSKVQKRVHLGKCACTSFDFLLYLGMNALCVCLIMDVGCRTGSTAFGWVWMI